jgi:hypothetical protein
MSLAPGRRFASANKMLADVSDGSEIDINMRTRQNRFDPESAHANVGALNNPLTPHQRCSRPSEKDSNLKKLSLRVVALSLHFSELY